MGDFEQAGWANEAFKPIAGKTVVMFYNAKPKKDNFQSAKQERDVFVQRVHIVKIPADPKLRIDRPVRESDKEEYPNEWAQWLRTQQTRVLGTPVDQWPAISDSQKEELKAAKLYTVEQVASMPDSYANVVGMGFNDLREKARIFTTQGKDMELVGKMRAEFADEKAAMQKQIDEMKAMMEEFTNPKKQKVSA